MRYQVLAFFDQSSARAFNVGEIVNEGDLTPDQIARAITAGCLAPLEPEAPKPEPEAPAEGKKAKGKTARHYFSTTMPKENK